MHSRIFHTCSEEQLCERCAAAAIAAAAPGGEQSSLLGAEERAPERRPASLGLCKHGAPSCCERCVGKALASVEHKKHRSDKGASAAGATKAHKQRVRRERESASSSTSSPAAENAENAEADLLAQYRYSPTSSRSTGVGAEACPSLAGSKKKPKVALRTKLANTSARAVASLDAYIHREEKRLAYWSEKFNQCGRILR